jgi:Bacterial archaeo-eukaryotic release factor family 11
VTLHTDIPPRSEVERLLTVRAPGCISIYLPTSVITQDAQADRIELKNLAASAIRQLDASGAAPTLIAGVRDGLGDLVDDDDFWAVQARSLAVFAAADWVRTYRLPNRLSSVVEVADRFYLTPLLRAVTFPQAAFVLALAAGSVRLVEVTPEGPPYTVDVPGMPTDAASSVGKSSITERSPIRRIQGSEGQKIRLSQFARKVEQAVRGVLSGLELPLILAASEPLDSIYRSLNSYPHLVERGIRGNPEGMPDERLAAAARPVLDEVYAAELSAVRDLFELRFQQGRASTDVATVARAANHGAIDTLFADIDVKLPGFIDDDTGAIEFAQDDAASYGIVDEIARQVLLSGGRVLAVRAADVPHGGPVAAILRYTL